MTAQTYWQTSAGLANLTRDLAAVPPEIRKQLRPALRTAGQLVLSRARQKASWSTRIPAAMSVRLRLAGDRPGAIITVSKTAAPHARPFEGILGGSSFRHPVFGNRDAWVTQSTRPFLWPAAKESSTEVATGVRAAVDTAMKAHGL